jgi:hypothetical protein
MILARLPVVDEQAATLAAWLPPVGMFGLFLEQNGPADRFRFGREADGTRPRHGAGKTWTDGRCQVLRLSVPGAQCPVGDRSTDAWPTSPPKRVGV